MDPLSISVSIIAVLQAITSTVNMIRDYVEADNYKRRVLVELSGTRGILETLNDAARSDTGEDSKLSTLREPLDSFGAILDKLNSSLKPALGFKKMSATLKWPFSKNEIESMLAAIERHKALFSLALHADQAALLRAIRADLVEANKLSRSEEIYEVLNWLSGVDFEAKHMDVFAVHEIDTGQWFLQDPRFEQWQSGASRQLWCPGVPGAGKTVLSSIVIEHMRSTLQPTQAILGIYCNYKEYNQQSTSKYIASLLSQLILRQGNVPSIVRASYVRHRRTRSSPDLAEYLTLIASQLNYFSRVFVVIDALDECTEVNNVRDNLLEAVLNLPEVVSLLITSRYIPGIELHFEGALKIPVRAHESDIERYARRCLVKEKIWARRIRLDSDLETKIASRVVQGADGMFLLAHLHISAVVRKHSRRDVEQALLELPKGLIMTYDQIVERINSQSTEDAELAKTVLSWLTHALAPLQVEVLQQALAIRQNDTTFDQDAVIHHDDFLDVCAGLVVIDEQSGIIRFVHHTTQTYFSQAAGTALPGSPLNLATTCLTFLSFSAATKENLPKLYSYVADHWGHHVRDSPETQELVTLVSQFVTNQSALNHCVKFMSTGRLEKKITALTLNKVHIFAKFDLYMTAISLLERSDRDINGQDNEGRTPLYYAVESEKGLVAELLLQQDHVKIDIASEKHGPPLHRAIEMKREQMALRLLDQGANPESADIIGERPIHKAIRSDSALVLRKLLTLGVDMLVDTFKGHTPFEIAQELDTNRRFKIFADLGRPKEISAPYEQYSPCLKLMLEFLDESRINSSICLTEACKEGRPDIVKLLLQKGANPCISSSIFNYRVPLHWAAEKGYVEVTKVLLESEDHGGIGARDARGLTPLHYAVVANQFSVVQLLTEHMNDLEVQSNDKMTALQYAKRGSYQDVISLLVKKGARDLEVTSHSANDPHFEQLRFISSSPPDMFSGLGSGANTPKLTGEEYRKMTERFLIAARDGEVEVVLIALSKGISVTERDHVHMKTALHWAAECGHLDITDLLLQWGSDLSSQDIYGELPMHYAAEPRSQPDVQKLLLAKLTDKSLLNVLDHRGRTPLKNARDNHCTEIVRILAPWWDGTCEEGELEDRQGKTLLHWAGLIGGREGAELWTKLKDKGVGDFLFKKVDHRGLSPLDYLRQGNDEAMTKIRAEVGDIDLDND